jgi:hypothetical protein
MLHQPFSVSELRRVAETSQLERRTEPDVPRKPLMKTREELQEGQETQESQG